MTPEPSPLARLRRVAAGLGALGLVGYGLWLGDSIADRRWLAILGLAWLLLLVAVWPPLPRALPVFNRTVVRTALILATVFAIVTLQLVRIQVIQGEATTRRVGRDPATGEVLANPRLVDEDLSIDRGRVFDRDGAILADTDFRDGIGRRSYPDPTAAYVVGYYSPLLYGKSGLEAAWDEELRGDERTNPLTRGLNDLLHRPQQGLDLRLTLDADLQRAAHDLLAGRVGAVVLVEVETGAVLALASNPNFDPNQLVTSTPSDRASAAAAWKALNDDPARPLLLRATDGLYTPGSTFKTVTAAAGIDAGLTSPSRVYEDDGELNVDGHVIVEFNRPDPSVTEWTLTEGLAWSLNVVFAQVGLQLGAKLLTAYARAFGFDGELPFDLPLAPSQLASSADFLDAPPALADTAFGQGELLATPLHMALVAAAIANDGKLMRPYLVERTTTRGGRTTWSREPDVWRRPVSAETADSVAAMMVEAVRGGYAAAAAIEGLVVGGKTGTAEVAGAEPHSWFIAFAGDPDPRYAVAVVLEHGGAGTGPALTIGRDMLAAAFAAE